VELDLPDDLPLVLADPLLFEQAIANILDNAAKYAPAGSVIRVRGTGDPVRVNLSIEDEGPGLSPDDLPHIFDKFYRAKAADRRVAGTGLGLAVARGFVEAFGGTLDASNRTDRSGAVLTMTLPIAPGRTHGL
jgi:two-component system sensor histidine kinase KdpD